MLVLCWLCWPQWPLSCPYGDPMFALCWPQLPLSCPYGDPMFAYVGLRNANLHSSDRKVGGGEGVTTGAARVYPAVLCYAEGQAICGFSHRGVPSMSATPEIGAG